MAIWAGHFRAGQHLIFSVFWISNNLETNASVLGMLGISLYAVGFRFSVAVPLSLSSCWFPGNCILFCTRQSPTSCFLCFFWLKLSYYTESQHTACWACRLRPQFFFVLLVVEVVAGVLVELWCSFRVKWNSWFSRPSSWPKYRACHRDRVQLCLLFFLNSLGLQSLLRCQMIS